MPGIRRESCEIEAAGASAHSHHVSTPKTHCVLGPKIVAATIVSSERW